MKIRNINHLTPQEIQFAVQDGARFVIFQYCFSILIMTFKQTSDIYFIESGKSTIKYSFLYSFISLLFGWWGIPWGPIYTISTIAKNITGGIDVTNDIIKSINQSE